MNNEKNFEHLISLQKCKLAANKYKLYNIKLCTVRYRYRTKTARRLTVNLNAVLLIRIWIRSDRHHDAFYRSDPLKGSGFTSKCIGSEKVSIPVHLPFAGINHFESVDPVLHPNTSAPKSLSQTRIQINLPDPDLNSDPTLRHRKLSTEKERKS